MVEMDEIKFDYDQENDSLFIFRPNEKVKGSVEIGEFVVDLDMSLNKVVGLEIINASKTLALALSNKINKTALTHMKKAFLRTEHKDNAIYVLYGIVSVYRDKKIEENTLIPVAIEPTINKP